MVVSPSSASRDRGPMRTRFLLGLILVAFLALPSWGVLGNVTTPWCGDKSFLVEETLGVPSDTQMTVSVFPSENIDLYVEYATDLVSFSDDTTTVFPATAPGTPVNALEQVRADFVLLGLTADTKYFYRFRCRAPVVAGSDLTWTQRPIHSFKTLPDSTIDGWKFVTGADSHIIKSWTNEATCGTIHESETNRWNSTVRSILADKDQYRFYVDVGDSVMTHCAGCSNCVINAGTDDALSTGSVAASNQPEADARYQKWLNLNWHLKQIPLVYALGNHDAEVTAWTTINHSFTNGTVARAARLAYMANPTDTYTRAPDLADLYYDFVSGDAHFFVIDPFTYSTSGVGTMNPVLADHWLLGTAQTTWLDNGIAASTSKFNFVLSHHLVGGASGTGDTWYGRGGLRATTSQTGMTGVCSHDAGEACTGTSTCEALQAGSYCTNGFGGDPLDDFAGQQADIQGWLETAAEGLCNDDGVTVCRSDADCSVTPDDFCGGAGAGIFLYGHDHFAVLGEKSDSSGLTNVHYVLAGKSAGEDRTGWADQPRTISQYDYDEGPLGITDGATSALYDSTEDCWETGQCGTMERGFFEAEFFKDESVGFRYRLATDQQRGAEGGYLPHLAYGIDASLDYQNRATCKAIYLHDQSVVTFGIDDDCPSAATPDQGGVNTMEFASGACVESTDVPGVYGNGADPRYSCNFTLANTSGYDEIDATDIFAPVGGASMCTWFKPLGSAVQDAQTLLSKGNAVLSFRYVNSTKSIRFVVGGSVFDSLGGAVVTADQWNHACVTWAGNTDQTIKMFVNGVDVGCELSGGGACVAGGVAGAATTLRLGYNPSNSHDYEGFLHETQFHAEELAPEQVCRLARCGAFDHLEDEGFACEMPAGQSCQFAPLNPYPVTAGGF